MRILHSEIRIRASPEVIWNAFLVSTGIPPEIRKAISDGKTGQKLTVSMSSGGRNVTLTVKILAVDLFREIRWKGYLWIPGLFDGEHSFEIRENNSGDTLLIQREVFTGLLLPFLSGVLKETLKEFERTNAAIKDQSERGVH
jgi:hypothetical protein